MRDWIDYMHMSKVGGRWVIVNVLWELTPEATKKYATPCVGPAIVASHSVACKALPTKQLCCLLSLAEADDSAICQDLLHFCARIFAIFSIECPRFKLNAARFILLW